MPSNNSRLHLYAPSVHTGGGLVLLKDLLHALPPHVHVVAWLDDRCQDVVTIPANANITWVKKTVLSRLFAEVSLAKRAKKNDKVLCFHGLPPLVKNKAQIHVFLQNRLYLEELDSAGFSFFTSVRLAFERRIFRWFRYRVDSYWVQTPSMARCLLKLCGSDSNRIHICPFATNNGVRELNASQKWDFVYIADGEAHKNHRNLVEAWKLLSQQSLRPNLALTLSERDSALKTWVAETAQKHDLRITDLGQRTHNEVLNLYSEAQALIFPSKSESFGLPLIEATQAGLPILAGEMDFVRDVCEPVQTFDPNSPVSIARAVLRFLGQPEKPIPTVSPKEFIESILEDQNTNQPNQVAIK